MTQEQKELARLVEEGYTVVLLGTPNHPEVVGLLGFAPDAILVDEEEDWARIPRRKRMALLTQSTQPPWKFERLAAFLVSRAHELKIVNTVCPVTIRRQQDTTDLAGRRGPRGRGRRAQQRQHPGAHPARGHRRASRPCRSSTPRPRRCLALRGRRTIGVTGGTTTPIEDLEAVAQRIYELAGTSAQARADELAGQAVTAVAESAYRSTSLSAA